MKSPADLYKRFNDYLDEERPIYTEDDWDEGDEWDDEDDDWDDEDWCEEEDDDEYDGAGWELACALGRGLVLVFFWVVIFPVAVVLECMKLNKN